MRLRYVLLLLFLFITVVPLSVFWAWPHSQSLQKELDEVRDRHLLLARNLGAALQRYHRDVNSAFNLLVVNLIEKNKLSEAGNILSNLDFKHICVINESSGKIIADVSIPGINKSELLSPKRIKILTELAKSDKNVFSPVMKGPQNKPIMYVVKRHKGHLAIGALSTEYFISLGKSIAFGVKGHAAIVDQEGNVLAHPLDSWIQARRNIAKVSAVKRMLNGETGIETFFSPALKGDMIAGFTAVYGTGWGVMIPQPIIELQQKADHIKNSSLVVFTFGLLIASISAFLVSIIFAKPIEGISKSSNDVLEGNNLSEINESKGWFVPIEFSKLQSSFNAMVRKLHENFIRIHKLAYEDTITKLPNRTFFINHVTKLIQKMKAKESCQGLMFFIDLDGFKAANDTFGHDCGDDILRQFSKRIQTILNLDNSSNLLDMETTTNNAKLEDQNNAIVARLGGDEFAIFIPNISDQNLAQKLADEIIESVNQPFKLGCHEANIGASIGISSMPKDSDDFERLLKYADVAMYHAKKTGKNKAEFFSNNIENTTLLAEKTKQELYKALKCEELELFYQPRYNLETKTVDSFETLVRWNHPQKGFMLPTDFLPMVEDMDIIFEIDDWVLKNSMQQLEFWTKEYPDLSLSINISPKQIYDPERASQIIEKVQRHNFDPSQIELEITEHALFESMTNTKNFIGNLRSTGYRIAIDDFGRGYSNFSRLIELPVDVIKIDKSLVDKLTEDERVPVIIQALINMAKGMGAKTVSEGVETLETASVLSKMNCNEIQGHLISKPLSSNNVMPWLKSSRPEVHKIHDQINLAFANNA